MGSKQKKRMGLMICLVLLGIGLSYYFTHSSTTKQGMNDLVIGARFGIGGSIDPKEGLGGPNMAPKMLIFEPLVYFDENFNMQPRLLKSWQASADAKTWTLYLKDTISFSDGTPFNADAVKFSFGYMTRPFSAYDNIESIECIDDYTVQFKLKKPDAIFIHTISFLGMMSPNCVDGNGNFVAAIGTGPFKFVDYMEEQQLVYERNPDYWGEKPKVEKVFIKPIPDHNTRSMALESGEIDIADFLPVEIVKRLEADPNFTVSKIPSPFPNWIGMNTQKEPFNDVRVRKAVNYAIDVKSIIDTLINSQVKDLATPAIKGPHSQALFKDLVNPDLHWYGFDKLKAEQLLDAAGWKDTDGDGIRDKNGRPFKPRLISSRMYAEGTEISEAIQSQLKNVGIDLDVEVVDSAARFQALRENKYDLIELSGICAHNDPTPWYQYYFHSSKHPAYSILKNDAVNTEIDKLSTTIGKDARRKVFFELQRLLEENAPGIFLYIQKNTIVYRKDIKNFKMNCGASGFFSYAQAVSK